MNKVIEVFGCYCDLEALKEENELLDARKSNVTSEFLLPISNICSICNIGILKAKEKNHGSLNDLPKWVNSVITFLDNDSPNFFYAENTIDYLKKKINEA